MSTTYNPAPFRVSADGANEQSRPFQAGTTTFYFAGIFISSPELFTQFSEQTVGIATVED